MENGEPAYIAGKIGIEIVLDVVSETMGKSLSAKSHEHMGRCLLPMVFRPEVQRNLQGDPFRGYAADVLHTP